MDSAIFIFVITITILDCNGLREQLRNLQNHRRQLDNLDDFRIPRRSNFFYAGMNPSQSNVPPYPTPEKEHKTGTRVSRTGNSMSVTYGGNLDRSEEEFYEPEYRRAHQPRNTEPALVIALLRSNKGATAEEESYRPYMQNDRRTPEVDLSKTPPQDFDFTAQQRAINLMELPIARYIKDYHKIEQEIQKREAEMTQKQESREITADAQNVFLKNNYNNFKEEMTQNQKRYQVMQEANRSLKKENLLKEYERKNGPPQGQDPQAFSHQNQVMSMPRPTNQNLVASRPLLQDMPRQQNQDLQYQDIMGFNEYTTSRSATERINPEEVYNSIPNWQTEPKPLNLAARGIKAEENYNWQAVLDQSSANLADMSIESLVSEYRKLEQEIVRRKKVVENYKKTLNQQHNNDQMKKPEYSQNNEFFPPSRPSLPSPQGPSGRPGRPGPPGSQGSRGRPVQASQDQSQAGSPGLSDPLGLPGWPGQSNQHGTPDPFATSPTRKPQNNWKQESPEGTTELSQPYLSDSELATLFTPLNLGPEVTTESYQFDFGLRDNPPNNAKMESNETTIKGSASEIPTGIVTYPNRKSLYEPELDQLYVIYLQRLRPLSLKKMRHRHRPLSAYHYAYVDLENLEAVLKRYRRQRASPKTMDNEDDEVIENRSKLKQNAKSQRPTLNDDPAIISSDEDSSEFRPPKNNQADAKSTWLHDSVDAYNHIKLDPEAPEMVDFMPKGLFQDPGNKWWFYNQADYNPFRN